MAVGPSETSRCNLRGLDELSDPCLARLPSPELDPENFTPVAGRPVEEGRASWYGPGFHGRTTSSGKPFDTYALTLAHRHIPNGTSVRLTLLDDRGTPIPSQRPVIARVNDWGPVPRDRIADLSKALIWTLSEREGLHRGIIRVRIEVVREKTPVEVLSALLMEGIDLLRDFVRDPIRPPR